MKKIFFIIGIAAFFLMQVSANENINVGAYTQGSFGVHSNLEDANLCLTKSGKKTGLVVGLNVLGNGNVITNGSDTPKTSNNTDFGTKLIDSHSSILKTYIITNTGVTTIEISSVDVYDAGGNYFSFGCSEGEVVAGGYVEFEGEFYEESQDGYGLYSGTVVIEYDNFSNYTFVVQGMLATPKINVKGNGINITNYNATPEVADGTDFGVFERAVSAVVRTFTVHNTGNADLVFMDFPDSINLNGDVEFEIVSQPLPETILPSSNASFEVSFTPNPGEEAGEKISEVEIRYTDIDSNLSDDFYFSIKADVRPLVEFISPCVSGNSFETNGLLNMPIELLGTCSEDYYTLCLTNTTTGWGTNTIQDATSWENSFITLVDGSNIITAVADYSGVISTIKTITIIFDAIIPPVICITNLNDTVDNSITTYTIGGTNSVNVVGVMNWTNSLSGENNTFLAQSNWEITNFSLLVGANVITVSGTNSDGYAANDSVTINRLGLGDGTPFINITNENTTVNNDITKYTIGGTNNSEVVGTMTWFNSAGGFGTFPATFAWEITNIILETGANEITVIGMNGVGSSTNDTITITRGAPDIAIFGNGQAITNGDVTPRSVVGTDFGNVVVGKAVTNTFVIFNTGTVALTITDITIDIPDNFEIVGTPFSSPVPSGGSTSFQIKFEPDSIGSKTAAVTVESDDADTPTYTFAIAGFGVANAPVINIQGNGQDVINGDVTPNITDGTDFGSVEINSVPATHSFTIINTGNDTLTINVSGTATDNSHFNIAGINLPASISPNGSTTFNISFTPDAVGAITSTVSIASNDSGNNPYTFVVIGVGTSEPKMIVKGNDLTIPNGDTSPATPDGTDFGLVDSVITKTFSITNTGKSDLEISGLNVFNYDDGVFDIGSQPATTIPPNQGSTFGVTFTPGTIGNQEALVTLNSNAGLYNFRVKAVTRPTVDFTVPCVSGDSYNTNGPVEMVINIEGTYTLGSDVYVTNTTTGVGKKILNPVLSWKDSTFKLARNANVFEAVAVKAGMPSAIKTITVYNQDPNAPIVEITSPNLGNPYVVSIGKHLTNIVGSIDIIPDSLVWSNSFSAKGGLITPVADSFDFSVDLILGTNLITVYATKENVIGYDNILIIVEDPPIDIVITGPNDGNSYISQIGDYFTNITGKLNLLPDSIVWTNLLTGFGGDIGANTNFEFSVYLTNGQNTIVVSATKDGYTASDQIVVGAVEPGELLLIITEPNGGNDFFVDGGATSTNISGILSEIPGSFSWSNSLGGGASIFLTTNRFDFLVDLKVGANFITVSTEKDEQQFEDSIAITVLEAVPVVNISTPNGGADYSITAEPHSTNFSGTVDVVPDSIFWTNTLTTANGVLDNEVNFTFNDSLEIGVNLIMITAVKNGVSGSKSIEITLENSETNAPVVAIISPNNGVGYTITAEPHSTNFSGTVDVVPDSLFWTNTLTGANGVLDNEVNFTFNDSLEIGVNLIMITAVKNGVSGSKSIEITLENSETNAPVVAITSPNNGVSYSIITEPHFTNFIGTVDIIPDSLKYYMTNSLGIYTGNLPRNLNFTNQIAELILGDNFIRFDAVKNGITGTASMVVTIIDPNAPDSRVLETWPRYIGAEQVGTIEFISSKESVCKLFVVNDPTTNILITSDSCAQGWNLIEFYAGDLPITDSDDSNIFQLVIGKGQDKETIPAFSTKIVENLKEGDIVDDFDGDEISVLYKGTGTLDIKGRTITVNGGSAKDKLTVKVKAAKGSGDGVAAICGVISENDIKMIKHSGDLDRLQIDGVMGKLMLTGGSLGRPNDTMRYNARFNAATTKSKSSITLKAGKNKMMKTVIPANCFANILVGQLEFEPNTVNEVAGLKALKITGGDLGVESCRKWLNAKYADVIMVKPKKDDGGKIFDYSFYFTGEGKPEKGSFKKLFFQKDYLDSSDSGFDNSTIVCGYDDVLNPITLTSTNWVSKTVNYSFGAIMSKGELQGTIAVKSKKGKVKVGSDKAAWIVNSEIE